MDESFVPMQAVLACVAGVATAVACGHSSGVPLVVIFGFFTIVWLVLAANFSRRTSKKIAKRNGAETQADQGGNLKAAIFCVIGLVVPLSFGVFVSFDEAFDGIAIEGMTATWIGVTISLILGAIFTSSTIDRYLILPFIYGLFGPPVWKRDQHLGNDEERIKRRRRYSKIWVAHRTVCEIVCFVGLALLMAIVLVTVSKAVSEVPTISRAIESIGGAGIAVGILGYLGPRASGGVDFVLGGQVGLGTWVSGIDDYLREVEGVVVSVSVYPGIKVRIEDEESKDGKFRFLPLKNADRYHDDLGDDWDRVGEDWRRRAQLNEHEGGSSDDVRLNNSDRPPEK